MNKFGGNWTESKMEIVISYAKAYLTIMNKQSWVRTLYFDGFAGSGLIEVNPDAEAVMGTALRILDLKSPRPFDMYYFVEKDEKNKGTLEKNISEKHPGLLNKKAFVVQEDCNKKLMDMALFLSGNKTFRALAFIDPYGMTVDWASIKALKGLGIDLWMLVPTGLGVNRLLKKDGNISEAWLSKLERFLGLSQQEIMSFFYKKQTIQTLFGEESALEKEKSTILKIGDLYSERLKTVFSHVSESYVMRNSTNSIMYHFLMATNNSSGLKIANEVIKPNYRL